MRYLITFTCYGAHLHGDDRGSVDRLHNVPGSRLLKPLPKFAEAERNRMDHPPYLLDQVRRTIVLETIQEVCAYRGWGLLAAHVRTNHVHVVIEANIPPEKIMNDFKAYCCRHLSRLAPEEADRKRWAPHGSTRWLLKDDDVREAVRYVVERQGEPMAVFTAF